jgi:hypothetical protein
MQISVVSGLLLATAALAQIQSAAKPVASRSYRFTCDYNYLDTKGNLSRRERISALYSRDLAHGRVKWSDTSTAEAGNAGDFGPAKKRDFMEGFGYARASIKDMLKPEFFKGFPPDAMFERNLVWDAHMIEGFGEDHWADLKPGSPRCQAQNPAGSGKAGKITWCES